MDARQVALNEWFCRKLAGTHRVMLLRLFRLVYVFASLGAVAVCMVLQAQK